MFLQFVSWVCVLQPVFVDDHRIYVPVLVEGDGLLQCLGVVIRSGLKYQEQVVCLCVGAHVCLMIHILFILWIPTAANNLTVAPG